MKPATLRVIFYTILGINAAFILIWWFIYSGIPATTPSAKLIALGRLSGLVAAYAALIELFLMSRLPSVERAFGLERLVNLHRWNGQIVFYSFIVHPILLSYGYQVDGKPSPIGQFVVFLQTYPDMIKALIGSILFLSLGGISYSLIRKRITYEAWYIIHLTAYIAIILAFFHQLSTGGDFIGHKTFSLYWTTMIIATFALITVYRFFSPGLILWFNKPHVSRVEAESTVVFSVYIAGKNFDRLHIRAGQYFGFQFLGSSLWGQSHPFTISKNPTDTELRITFKIYGGYTARLSKIKPGTKVLLDGPRGNSTWERSRLPHTLMIAGGIGITPMRALIEAAP
ncbi:MAG: ferric reductase-like transmembrane domain-containing protein, partial [Candidatus Saccharibacteria bacterium]